MGWIVAGIAIGTYLISLYMQSRIKLGEPGKIEAPTASEGIAIPVMFGTRAIASPNVVWFGNQSVESAEQQYNYYASWQLALCHGKLDELSAVYVDGVEAWSGSVTTNDGGLTVNTYGNGPGFVKYVDGKYHRQLGYYEKDGTWGNVRLRLGGVNSTLGAEAGVADRIASMMGIAQVPKFYGVASVYADEAVMMGLSPYLRPWSFVCRRIHTMRGGTTQWYDAKAEIAIGASRTGMWKYKVCAAADVTDYSAAAYDDSGWSMGQGGISNLPVGSTRFGYPPVRTSIAGTAGATNEGVPTGTKIWVRLDLGALPVQDLGVRLWHDDVPTLWFNGTQVVVTSIESKTDSSYGNSNGIATVPKALIDADGPNVIAFRVVDGGWLDSSSQAIYAGIEVGPDTQDPRRSRNMNPAHIIREALTDSIWGLGYADADIDDTTFTAAADQLYAERLGLSLLWDRQGPVEDFVNEVCRHIDAAIYVDRATGKFCLKLLRDDYVIGNLLRLDGDTVVSVDNVRRRTTAEMVNTVTLSYTGSLKGDTSTITVHDSGLLAAQGGIVSQSVSFPGFTEPSSAARVAARTLRVLGSPLLTCEIEASRAAAGLYPGDAFVLDWPDLDIDETVMRVLEIDIGDGLDCVVKIKCVEDVFALPDQPVVIPAPIYYPPQTLAPLVADSTRFHLAAMRDPNDRGQCACAFIGISGEVDLFGQFVETEPGVFVRSVAGPLADTAFDRIEPGAYDGDAVNVISVPRMIGRRVFAVQNVGFPGDPENSGPYIVDDVGGHYENYGTPEQTFVSTYARMHRDPDYRVGSQFIAGMTFAILEGDTLGGQYVSLTTDGVALGSTALAWTVAATHTWTPGRRLLTDDQLTTQNLIRETTVDEKTGADGVDCESFQMLAGVPNLDEIPAGDWGVQLEGAWVTGGDVGASTSLGFRVYRFDGSTGQTLFEFRSAALPGEEAPLTARGAAPTLKMVRADIVVIIPVIRTTSATPVTVHIRYGGEAMISAVTAPLRLGFPVSRSEHEVAFIADGVIAIPGRARAAEVTVAAGGSVVGIADEGFDEGDTVALTVHRGAGAAVTFQQGAAVAAGALPLHLSSRVLAGVVPGNIDIGESSASFLFQLKRTLGFWQALHGADNSHASLSGRDAASQHPDDSVDLSGTHAGRLSAASTVADAMTVLDDLPTITTDHAALSNLDTDYASGGAHPADALGPGRLHRNLAAGSVSADMLGWVTPPSTASEFSIAPPAASIARISRIGFSHGDPIKIYVSNASAATPKTIVHNAGAIGSPPADMLPIYIDNGIASPPTLTYLEGPTTLELWLDDDADVWRLCGQGLDDARVLTSSDDEAKGYLSDKIAGVDGVVATVKDAAGVKSIEFGLSYPRRLDVDYVFGPDANVFVGTVIYVGGGTWRRTAYGSVAGTGFIQDSDIVPAVNDNLLIAAPLGLAGRVQNGVFVLTKVGGPAEYAEFQRRSDCATDDLLPVGMEVFVKRGNRYGGTRAVLKSKTAGTLDSDELIHFEIHGYRYNETQVTEAQLNLHDVATGDATTAAHGLTPKLSGSTMDFLRGDGAWGVVPLGWPALFANLVPEYAPGVSDVRYVDLALLPGISGTAEGLLLGGGVQAPSSVTPITRTIIQAPSTTSWAFAFDAILPVPVSGQACCFGVVAPALTQSVHVWSQYALSVGARTKMIVATYDGTFGPFEEGPVIDGLRHTYVVAFDTYKYRLLVDGVVVFTSPAISSAMHMPTIPLALDIYQTGGAILKVSQAACAV